MRERETRREDATKEMDLFDYLEVIARRKKLVFWITSAAFAVSIIVALILPKSYESTARILPPPQFDRDSLTGLEGLASRLMEPGTPSDLYASILASEAVRDRIIDRFNLMKVYNETYRLDMYKKLDDLVDIEAGRKDGIISITVEDETPRRAADIANAYVEELVNLTVNLNVYDAGQNRIFLEGRLARARADLASAEDALKEFQAKNKAFQVPDQAEATISGIAGLKARLAAQEVQLSVLRTTFTDSSQEVTDALASVADLKSQISRLEDGKSSGAIPSLGSVPELGQKYVRLMREFTTRQALVEDLTKQYEKERLFEADNVAPIQVIQRARAADKKTRPHRTSIVLFSTFLALACSVGAAIAVEHYDRLPENTRRRAINLLHMFFSRNRRKKRRNV